MTENIQRLAQAILLGFALVGGGLLYWQVARAPELVARDDNPRLVQAELRVRRGRLLDRYGEVLAHSDPLPGPAGAPEVLQRRYQYPQASHVVGYYSLRYGTGGAEAVFDKDLRGQLSPLDRLLHRPQIGRDATLSIDLAAQRAADEMLGERAGAVVVLDAVSGEVLALVSHPTYDPNRLDEEWDALAADPDAPLLNRATQGVYPLGDLARLVGLTGLLSSGITTPHDPHTAPLDDMLAPLSESGYLATARQLGFDAAPPFDLPTGPGLLPDFEDKGTPRDLAVTPLHMARLAAAISHDGLMPIPTLAYPGPAGPAERAFAPGVAASLQAVTPTFDGLSGWAGVATPKETGDQPLSWFVGYTPRYAIALVVEGSQGGASVTLPMAQDTVGAIHTPAASPTDTAAPLPSPTSTSAPLPTPSPTGTVEGSETTPIPGGRWSELLQRTPYPYSRPLPPANPTVLDGTYTRLDPRQADHIPCRRCPAYPPGGGIWKLNLDKGVFRVYHELTGWVTLGSFTVSGDRIEFFNDPHCFQDTGIYTWELEEGKLTLTAVKDSCGVYLRVQNLEALPWESCQPPSTEAAITSHWPIPAGCKSD
jgi:hypothetical protein